MTKYLARDDTPSLPNRCGMRFGRIATIAAGRDRASRSKRAIAFELKHGVLTQDWAFFGETCQAYEPLEKRISARQMDEAGAVLFTGRRFTPAGKIVNWAVSK
jgi:hypothetical protein